ncbi:MAG: hypothetical protein HY314_08360, partial [Acidobacteria bacterium]|nr:hypothetical protein [Acidobacteriota bacterium]
DGRFWVATNRTLCEFLSSRNERGHSFRAYPKSQGLGAYEIVSLAEDQYGNLWMGTNSAGAMKLARSGFVTFGEEDGFTEISAIFEKTNGELCVVGGVPGNLTGSVAEGVRIDATDPASILYWRRLGRFDGQKFTWLRPNAPKRIKSFFGWGWNQTALQDHTGEWWIMTYGELYRFPKTNRFEDLKTIRPKAVYTTQDGLASPDLFRIFEDSSGDIWISSISSIESGLAQWERVTETWHDLSRTDGLPSFKEHAATAFREDRAGHLWIGFSWGGLARYRDGKFTYFTADDGVPPGWIYDLYVDHAGRLWIASTLGGLARVDDPSADRPTSITYTTADGLSSNKATCLTEDRYGCIYVGTSRGLDRLDPATGRVKHFTSADGLVPGEIVVLFCDRKGDIWIGNPSGLSRLTPHLDPPQSPPPILINGLRIAGIQQTVSALGESTVALPDLAADKNQLQIDFVGLSFALGESLRYQYKLEGADREWSPPTDQRMVNYANLAPGRYRFLVRAINSDGVATPTPAMISFTILPPLWQRWWFLMGVAAFVAGAAYLAYRYRVAQLTKLERVRTRIATDLHDDIGSSLSQIAILSEVARQEDELSPRVAEPLDQIATVSRELVDAMSDIVWAINPHRDSLPDLTRRVRRFASDMFTARNIAFHFRAPEGEADVKLDADVRRQVFMIFKESINNIVRHSGCTQAEIELEFKKGRLQLRLSDNGCGFDAAGPSYGHGLMSMRERARSLGGELEVDSQPGRGTVVTLQVPITRRRDLPE